MTTVETVKQQIRQHFHEVGLDPSGKFIGNSILKERAIATLNLGPTARQAVNAMSKAGEFPGLVNAAKRSFVPPPLREKTWDQWVADECHAEVARGTSKKKMAGIIMQRVPPCYTAEEIMSLKWKVRAEAKTLEGGVPLPNGAPTASAAPTQATGQPSPNFRFNLRPRPAPAPSSSSGTHAQHFPNPRAPSPPPAAPLSNPKIKELLENNLVDLSENKKNGTVESYFPSLTSQADLFDFQALAIDGDIELAESEVKNAVAFSSNAFPLYPRVFRQYALLAAEVGSTALTDPRLFLNTNLPWSFFICGLQGSGKSHSLGCLLENCLIPSRVLGVLERPLSGIVFHFGQYTSRTTFHPCEAAFLSSPGLGSGSGHSVPVTVLVSPSNFRNLSASYSQIPGITVKPLRFRPQELNIGSLLTLMSVDESDKAPLYMAQVTKILRDMSATSDEFSYYEFKARLDALKLSAQQRVPLGQRLDLLESFLDFSDGDSESPFSEGSLTIVDLSCPFVDPNSACCLFNICLNLFLSSPYSSTAGVIAVDEAHKYIGVSSPASKALTESLITIIRQQRHFGARIIISTQEPTIDTRLMDLSSAILIHRFTSPEWFSVLKRHVSLGSPEEEAELLKRIVSLRVGEGLLFCPSAIVEEENDWEDDYVGGKRLKRLEHTLLKVKVRKRVTWDGGKSILAVR